MDTKNIGEEAEALVRRIDDDLTTPHDGECLVCFLSRMVAEFGCDGTHRFARRFRDLRVPRATGLEMRLARKGGYCDCEVLFNAYEPARHLWTPEHTILDEDGEEVLVEAEEPQLIPACAGIPRGSAQPCRNWETQR